MKACWIDPGRGIHKSYTDLLTDLNQQKTLNPYRQYENPYDIIYSMLYALCGGQEIHLLDADFSLSEIEHLGISNEDLLKKIKGANLSLNYFDELIRLVERNKDNSSIVIYTSGTTGRPKKVIHQLNTLTRTVKKGSKFVDNIWAFAYNMTHFAGLQVFFQAFLNQNPMIYIFELNGNELIHALHDNHITNISATPTFYKKLITSVNTTFPGMKRVTLGGEKFDPAIEKELKKIFPNAVIRNIYASTEAGSLFHSENETFTITDDLKPYVQISPKGELLIHNSLLGIFESSDREGQWYHTGDMVEMLNEKSFRFVSRKNEMINVGGYKVNPYEVEEEIRQIEGVMDVLIKARSNPITGNILQADIVKNSGIDETTLERNILKHLEEHLQAFKIPRIIKFVSSLQMTRTGKKERR